MFSIREQVSGSSLVEVVTSMVILSIVFSSSILVFVNVQRGTNSMSKVRAEALAKNEVERTLMESDWETEQRKVGQWTVNKELTLYVDHSTLMILHIEIRTETDVVLYDFKRLVYMANKK